MGTEVTYSKDFNFFLEHQIFLITCADGVKYCSRLEAKQFYLDIERSPEKTRENCRDIWTNLKKEK